MAIPVGQMMAVGRYLLKQRLAGRERYPLVLMLEPLFRCNLSCTGCGKIQYPSQLLRRHLSVDECVAASDECGAPIVSVAGGEPLLHPEIAEITRALVDRRRYIYLCTNAILLERKLDELELQPVASVPAVPDGKARLRVHALGQSHLQPLRLATALLSPPGRVRPHLPRVDGGDGLVEVRPQERQSALPGLHGALRIRAERRPRGVRVAAGDGGYRRQPGDGTAMTETRSAELVDRAFDCRGYVTLRRSDGSELVGFVYDRSASHLELFDETANRRTRIHLQ